MLLVLILYTYPSFGLIVGTSLIVFKMTNYNNHELTFKLGIRSKRVF